MSSAGHLGLLRTLNVVLFAATLYTGYWVFSADAAQAVTPKGRVPQSRATPAKKEQTHVPREMTEEEIVKVFSRSFAPEGTSDQSSSDAARLMLESLVPVNKPAPPSVEKAPELPPDIPPESIAVVKPVGPALETLVGVVAIMHDTKGKDSAVFIEIKKNREQQMRVVGERLSGVDATVSKINTDSVVFDYAGLSVTLKVEMKQKQSAVVGRTTPIQNRKASRSNSTHRHVPRTEIMSAMQKPLEVMQGLKYSVVRDNGKVLGFRVGGITTDNLFAKYGLQNNDIVRAINGKPLDASFNPLLMMTELVSSDVITVDIRRNNQDIPMSFKIGE